MEEVAYNKSISRKDQIREVAERLFREKGYSATSMRDLAREVGIEPASLYNHIASKESILKEICFRMADEFFEAINNIYFQLISPDEKMRLAMSRHIDIIVRNMDSSSVFFNEWRNLKGEDLSRFKSLRINYEWKFKEILKEGVDKGVFKDIDQRIVIFTIFSALNAVYDLRKPGVPFNAEEVSEKITTIILSGLKN